MEQTIFTNNIHRGIDKGILQYSVDKKKIIYRGIGTEKKDKQYNINNPEEQVRASVFVELVLDYLYSKELMDLEISTPHRTPSYFADIVVFNDKENKDPYIVVEVKKDGISNSELEQAKRGIEKARDRKYITWLIQKILLIKITLCHNVYNSLKKHTTAY